MMSVTQLQSEVSDFRSDSVVSFNAVCPYEMRSFEICHVFCDD